VLLLLPKAPSLTPAAGWLGSIAVPIFLVLLWPGSLTPKGTSTAIKEQPKNEDVEKYFAGLQWAEAQATADARMSWLKAPLADVSPFGVHVRYGPADAPVKLVEFTDILCGHCAALIATLDGLKKAVPAGHLSIEPRYFPLDAECNKQVKMSSGDGVRCLGAKAQICLESSPQYWALRSELFENQASLSKEKIFQIASKGMAAEKLQACLAAPQTQMRLDQDVAYATLFNPQGTPIVVLNGKETPPVPAFLYGMMMGKGDANTKYFAKLPAAR